MARKVRLTLTLGEELHRIIRFARIALMQFADNGVNASGYCVKERELAVLVEEIQIRSLHVRRGLIHDDSTPLKPDHPVGASQRQLDIVQAQNHRLVLCFDAFQHDARQTFVLAKSLMVSSFIVMTNSRPQAIILLCPPYSIPIFLCTLSLV
jgi:hypothetical protein